MTALDGADKAATDTLASLQPGDRPRPTLRWWRELLYAAAFYGIYSLIRDTQGSASAKAQSRSGPCANSACHHATDIIRLERHLRIYDERAIQHAFIGVHWFLQFWNLYYGSAHFVVTVAVLIWLFRRDPERYPLWRNTLAVTTALALVGFALFPLMPPRLLPSNYGFVDTLRRFGGSWSFDSGAVQKVSNQYAAMPSLHCAWAGWCACALYPACRRWWTRALVVIYPIVTVFAVVVTANHYFLDAVAGAIVFGLAYAMCAAISRATARRGSG